MATLLAKRKPKIALLSPFPPDKSGCARFTELTIRAAQTHFDIDLYSNAPRPLGSNDGFCDLGPVDTALSRKRRYDAVISIIGNSAEFHASILDIFEHCGGPCILHDSRLIGLYYERLSHEGFKKFAERHLGQNVTDKDVSEWLHDRNLPSLFVEPVLERAQPLIVHTHAYQQVLRQRYGFEAHVTTFPPNIEFAKQDILASSRRAARSRLGLPDAFIVSTFGYVHPTKCIFTCISAIYLLRSWNIPAKLYFVGASYVSRGILEQVARDFGVWDHIHLCSHFIEQNQYRDYLIASDAAISLRSYGFGQPSATLAEAISAALPTVASIEIAEACEAPSYVNRISGIAFPHVVAEGLAEIWQRGTARENLWAERNDFSRVHNFDIYARRLKEILGFP